MKQTLKMAVAGALLSLAGVASAATVTQTSTTIIDITHSAASSFNFAGFDTSLGELTSVQYTFYSTISGTARVENMAAVDPAHPNATTTTTIGTGAAVTLTVAGLPSVTVNAVYSQDVALKGYDGLRDYAGTSGVIKTFTGQSVTSSTGLLTSTAALNAFETNNVSTSFSGVFLGSGTGNVSFSGNSKVNTYAVLTYNYTPTTPVPEPETYAMLLAGLGMMGVVARRKAKKSA